MRVYGVIGWKNSGKTSLMERLVAEITGRGFRVSTIKHVHHDVDLDQPGKDTFRHRAAGAIETVLASAHRYAVMHEHRGPEPDLTEVLTRLKPVDLVLVEGYKRDSHPKLEVWRRETGHQMIQPDDPLVRAVATDAGIGPLAVPVLDLNNTAAIADFVLAEVGLPVAQNARFDSVAVVDWSSSATPSPAKPSADAIWIGVAGQGHETATYHRTRADAETALCNLIATERAAGRRLLIGFDFPMGYPAGFAARLTGTAHARAVWRWLAERITDAPDNANNRFAVADQINAAFGGKGPFWGRPATLPLPHLAETKSVDYARLGLQERRLIDQAVPKAQPVWKCYTTGSVGGQALMGLPLIHRLSNLPGVGVWPFDAPDTPVVLAEVYPSLLAPQVAALGGIKDQAQVHLLSRALLRLAQDGTLPRLFDTPAAPVTTEEGWVLGAGFEALLAQAAG